MSYILIIFLSSSEILSQIFLSVITLINDGFNNENYLVEILKLLYFLDLYWWCQYDLRKYEIYIYILSLCEDVYVILPILFGNPKRSFPSGRYIVGRLNTLPWQLYSSNHGLPAHETTASSWPSWSHRPRFRAPK